MRKVFTRLVRVAQPDEGAEDTKRRINLNELDAAIQPLVRKLADARLLVTGHDDETGEETVEVAHEALDPQLGRVEKLAEWRPRVSALAATAAHDGGELAGQRA